ncbi:hypothetical protein ACQ4M3_29055 [Leptolyngbya sp. AN03gr2]|uniref:hypothetical protein n=1 Tax=unclassified Leptolyngbya TaxID=2650499 RepID=UPI003D323979
MLSAIPAAIPKGKYLSIAARLGIGAGVGVLAVLVWHAWTTMDSNRAKMLLGGAGIGCGASAAILTTGRFRIYASDPEQTEDSLLALVQSQQQTPLPAPRPIQPPPIPSVQYTAQSPFQSPGQSQVPLQTDKEIHYPAATEVVQDPFEYKRPVKDAKGPKTAYFSPDLFDEDLDLEEADEYPGPYAQNGHRQP